MRAAQKQCICSLLCQVLAQEGAYQFDFNNIARREIWVFLSLQCFLVRLLLERLHSPTQEQE